ncbi:MAG: SMC-Scp complex subunit ScpB, partial [Kofleriaceae bacterium]
AGAVASSGVPDSEILAEGSGSVAEGAEGEPPPVVEAAVEDDGGVPARVVAEQEPDARELAEVAEEVGRRGRKKRGKQARAAKAQPVEETAAVEAPPAEETEAAAEAAGAQADEAVIEGGDEAAMRDAVVDADADAGAELEAEAEAVQDVVVEELPADDASLAEDEVAAASEDAALAEDEVVTEDVVLEGDAVPVDELQNSSDVVGDAPIGEADGFVVESDEASDLGGDIGAQLPTSAASMDALQLRHLVEALVFASDKPMTIARLRQLTRVSDTKRLEKALVELANDYAERGIVLQQVSGGYQFRTRTQFSVWVQQLISGRPVRLSRAQLETLAIIAYRQPITRPEIDEIRGVDSSNTLKLLIDRSLIRTLGKKEEVGRPMLYGTTKEFLDFFSLGDLRELPTLREYSELTDESRRVMSDRLGVDPNDTPVESDDADRPDDEGDPSSDDEGGSDGGGGGGSGDGGPVPDLADLASEPATEPAVLEASGEADGEPEGEADGEPAADAEVDASAEAAVDPTDVAPDASNLDSDAEGEAAEGEQRSEPDARFDAAESDQSAELDARIETAESDRDASAETVAAEATDVTSDASELAVETNTEGDARETADASEQGADLYASAEATSEQGAESDASAEATSEQGAESDASFEAAADHGAEADASFETASEQGAES